MKNYHTHTTRCYHAIDKEEDYIKAAIQSGYTELGFSDHTPWHYNSSFHSTMRMEDYRLDDYISTLLKLKEKYKNQISIKIGLECEYFPQYIPWLKQVLKEQPIDYIILGNHYDETDETGIYFGWNLNQAQLTKYVDLCIEAIETGLYSYVAHPDVANYDTKDPFYQIQMRRICIAAKEHNLPLEFNLLGYKTKRHYPNDVFFRLAKEVGNRIIIGTDAHESSALLDMQTYQHAIQHLKDLGLEITEEIQFLK